jgi:hypothetical protein
MPSGNEDAYKRMYEMGKELMDMATAGGYNPDAETMGEGETEEVTDVESPEVPSSNKVSTALNFLRK